MSALETTLAAPASAQLLSIARRELSSSYKMGLAWLVPSTALLAMTLSMQPTMKEKGSIFEQKLALMPAQMRAAFGLDGANLADPVSYLATNATLFLLLGALFAALLGATLLSREELSHTVDLLLTRPVRRSVVLGGKLLSAIALVLAFDVVAAAVALAVYAAVGVELDTLRLVVVFAGAALLHLTLLAVAVLASVVVKRPQGAPSSAVALVFGSYGVGVVAATSEQLHFLGHLSPFRAVDPGTVAATGALPDAALALPVVALAAVVVALWRFGDKDMPS